MNKVWQVTITMWFQDSNTVTRTINFSNKEAAVAFLNKNKEQCISQEFSKLELSVKDGVDTEFRYGFLDKKDGTMHFGTVEEKPIFAKATEVSI